MNGFDWKSRTHRPNPIRLNKALMMAMTTMIIVAAMDVSYLTPQSGGCIIADACLVLGGDEEMLSFDTGSQRV